VLDALLKQHGFDPNSARAVGKVGGRSESSLSAMSGEEGLLLLLYDQLQVRIYSCSPTRSACFPRLSPLTLALRHVGF
jgi:hypothetical protein